MTFIEDVAQAIKTLDYQVRVSMLMPIGQGRDNDEQAVIVQTLDAIYVVTVDQIGTPA